jgi:hypothetical protein
MDLGFFAKADLGLKFDTNLEAIGLKSGDLGLETQLSLAQA